MVSKTFKRNLMFQWHHILEVTREDGDWFIYYYDPNGTDMYKIKLDAATVTMAKSLVTQIQTWMSQSDTWTGEVAEHRQLQDVPATTIHKEWVLVP